MGHSKAALVAFSNSPSKQVAGLAITLEPGWKTYWKVPGVAGVPPEFDWTGSENLKSASPLYPMPQRFGEASDETIGYQGEVVFPVIVEPLDVTKPVRLNLSLNYAVCHDVCVPASDRLSLDLSSAAIDQRAAKWMALVPSPVQDVVASSTVSKDSTGLHLLLKIKGQASDIFVESKTLAYFGRPAPGPDGEYSLPIYNVTDPAKLGGQPLLITLNLGDRFVEQTVTLP